MRVVASTLLHKLENFNGTMTLPSVGFAFRTYLNNCRRGCGRNPPHREPLRPLLADLKNYNSSESLR